MAVLCAVTVAALVGAAGPMTPPGEPPPYASDITVGGGVTIRGLRQARDAVVSLEPVDRELVSPPPPRMDARVDQEGLRFFPHVLVVTVGTVVEFDNSDAVLHNIFAPGEESAEAFDLGTWPEGETRTYRFDEPGVTALLCRVHPEMEAFIVTTATPYYAVTDQTGSYTISDVPSGDYRLKVWHERCLPHEEKITVTDAGHYRADVVLEPIL